MGVLSVRSERLFFVVSVIVYSLKIIGLAPFSVPIGKPARINPCNNRVDAFFVSKFGRAYNILLLILVMGVYVLFPKRFHHMSRIRADGLSMFNILFAIWKTTTVLLTVTACIIIICWAFRQKNAASILNRLLEVDVRLSALKKRRFNKRALIFLVIHGVLNVCLWTSYGMFEFIYNDEEKLTAFFRDIPLYVIYWFIMEYVAIVGLVSRDLQAANSYLLDLKEFGDYLSRPSVRNGNVQPVVISVPIHAGSHIASLKLLRSVRTTLSELCDDVADFFSFPILFCIASCFMPIIQVLYYTTQVASSYPPGFMAIYTVILILMYIYPVVSLTLNVTRTMEKAELTGRIVHKLLAVARTESIKAELEQFSLQLLHEKVNFTACGLFTLDSTLLQSMLGSVASYAIILIQFRSSGYDGNGNGNNTSAAE